MVLSAQRRIKTAAFKELYKNYDYKIQSQVMDYHIRNLEYPDSKNLGIIKLFY